MRKNDHIFLLPRNMKIIDCVNVINLPKIDLNLIHVRKLMFDRKPNRLFFYMVVDLQLN